MVSEMGEQWSPKMPPESTTPMAIPTGASMARAMEMAMGVKMANTLQLLPVEKEVRQAATKMMMHMVAGVSRFSDT